MWAWRETERPAQTKVMDNRYIKYFDGYRAAYGLADFDDPKAFVDPESGKKKPVSVSYTHLTLPTTPYV